MIGAEDERGSDGFFFIFMNFDIKWRISENFGPGFSMRTLFTAVVIIPFSHSLNVVIL